MRRGLPCGGSIDQPKHAAAARGERLRIMVAIKESPVIVLMTGGQLGLAHLFQAVIISQHRFSQTR
jgi:hypothetical protein